jgi:prolyl-tRNA editing enzyme YbaK/EbsC (Cys-tRNA(Pro) deacylase)
MGVKRASFADAELTVAATGMEIGGVVCVGLPASMPILIDSFVMEQPSVVMGGGNRTSKLLLDSAELLKLPGLRVVEGLANKVSEP